MTARLGPIVRGRVVHITCARNLRPILKAGAVSGNSDGRLKSSFGSSANGFFRQRNAVSVFDYRSVSNAEFEDAWCKCGPLTAFPKCAWRLALLFLEPEHCNVLQGWQSWHREQAWEQMLVPDVEAGYPAPLPISAIEEILEVRTRYYSSRLEREIAGSWGDA
jgi:hypothetical protein